jgi:hygromycin-B 4-O-kinase
MQTEDSYGHVQRLYPDDVTAFLRAHLGDGIDAVERIPLGQWSKAFSFHDRARERDFIVRFSQLDEDFRKDQRAMAYTSADLPVPRLVEIGEAFDGFYAISERAFGEVLEERDEASMRRVLPSLLAMLDATRRVDLSTAEGYGGWRGDGRGSHPSWRAAVLGVALDTPDLHTHGWRARLAQSEIGMRAFEAAFAEVERLVDACPNERHLVHSDLLYYNVLVADERISAVLDWGSSMYGDFLWDLAWFTFWQPWYTAWSGIDFRVAGREHFAEIGVDIPNFDERMRCYELCIGLDGIAYQVWSSRWSDAEWTAERTLAVVRG